VGRGSREQNHTEHTKGGLSGRCFSVPSGGLVTVSQCLGVSGYSWGSPTTFPLLVLVNLTICLLTVHDRWTQTGRPFSPYYRVFWSDCNRSGMGSLLTVVGVKGVDQGDRGR